MENFRKSMYEACRQMGLEIVPIDIAARVMAFINLQGGDERITYSPRMMCEIEHIQELYHIKGGGVPDENFAVMLKEYIGELERYTERHNGEWPEWLNTLIYQRYGFKPYKL